MGGKGLSRREFLARCSKSLFCLALTSFPIFVPSRVERFSAPSVHGNAGSPQEEEAIVR